MQDEVDAAIQDAFDRWANARQYTLGFREPLRRPFVAGYLAALDRTRPVDEPIDDDEIM